jgi:hypothetical protein
MSLTDESTSTLSSLLDDKSVSKSFSKVESNEFKQTGINFSFNYNARDSACFSFSQVFLKT